MVGEYWQFVLACVECVLCVVCVLWSVCTECVLVECGLCMLCVGCVCCVWVVWGMCVENRLQENHPSCEEKREQQDWNSYFLKTQFFSNENGCECDSECQTNTVVHPANTQQHMEE